MKKQHLFIVLSVVLLGFVFGVIQYYQALKTEDVSAVTVGIPNPGHSLAQLECSADSLCVDSANNRVGIGTANPIAKVNINTSGFSAPSSGIDSFGIVTTGTYGGGIGLQDGTGNFGIWVDSAGTAARFGFGTNLGGLTTVASILSTGNVGIGTATPVSKTTISGAVGSFATASVANPFTSQLTVTSDGGGENQPRLYVGTYYTGGKKAVLQYSDYWNSADHYGEGSLLLNPMGGNVGIGTTSPSYTLTVAGTAWVTSGSWSGSDIRWKKNINTLSQSSSLEKVMALNPVNYQWKTDEYPEMKFSNGTQLGFIAQDVEKIIPEVVTTNNEGYKGISYEKIVPVLTSAMQEQEKEIEQLKAIVCLDHPLAEVCK